MIRRRAKVDAGRRWGRAETRLQPAQGPLARALHKHGDRSHKPALIADGDPSGAVGTANALDRVGNRGKERAAETTSSGSSAAEIAARLARLEAVLLMSREPLPSRKLAQLAELADGTEARTLVRKLNAAYDGRRSAFRVEQSAGGYQLLTRAQFAPWLRRLHSRRMEVRLSSPALETLAVVAYRQPVVRAEIEAVRGVQCGEMLRQLMERDLVRIAGKSQELGRPFVYATTRQFLQMFGLRDLDDLPRADLLRKRTSDAAAGLETAPPKDVAIGNDEDSLLPKETPVTLALARPETFEEEDELRAALLMPAPVNAADEDEDEDIEDEDEDEEDDLEEEDEWEEVEDDEEEAEDEEEDEEWDEDDEEWDEDEEDDEEWDEEEEDDEDWDDEE